MITVKKLKTNIINAFMVLLNRKKLCINGSILRLGSKVVMQWTANPRSPVRFRPWPPMSKSKPSSFNRHIHLSLFFVALASIFSVDSFAENYKRLENQSDDSIIVYEAIRVPKQERRKTPHSITTYNRNSSEQAKKMKNAVRFFDKPVWVQTKFMISQEKGRKAILNSRAYPEFSGLRIKMVQPYIYNKYDLVYLRVGPFKDSRRLAQTCLLLTGKTNSCNLVTSLR